MKWLATVCLDLLRPIARLQPFGKKPPFRAFIDSDLI
jgi:hypothetical protein